MAPTVLLIEDNPVNVKLFSMLLRKAGHAVEIVHDAEQGMDRARALQPDLILMDLQLPGDIDGVRATELLKMDPETAHVPILVITAHAFPEIRDAAKRAGCDGFLTKPVVARTFLAAVDDQLRCRV